MAENKEQQIIVSKQKHKKIHQSYSIYSNKERKIKKNSSSDALHSGWSVAEIDVTDKILVSFTPPPPTQLSFT